MHRLLRLVMLWLIALALPVQGAAAATAMAMPAPPAPSAHPHAMARDMPSMADATPCPRHAAGHATLRATDKSGCCGDCCGPIVAQQEMLAVTPVAIRWAALPRASAAAAAPLFLTGGTDRPPRPLLA